MMDQTYDIDKARYFFEYLTRAYSKYEQKEAAKSTLKKHVEKIKLLSLEKKPSKKRIDQEFKQLEQQIANVVLLEKEIISRKDYKEIGKEVKSRIMALEKQLEKYIKLIEGRREKITKLEKKIKQKIPVPQSKPKISKLTIKDDETIKIRNQLYDLEERYHDLKMMGYSEKQLGKIRDKINRLKQKI